LVGENITVEPDAVPVRSNGPSLPSEPLLKLWAFTDRAKLEAAIRPSSDTLTAATMGFKLDFIVISSSRKYIENQNHLDATLASVLTLGF